jgi:hypothetical protein
MRNGRSTVRAFVAGMVVGGALVLLAQDRIRRYVNDRTRAVRLMAAERIAAVAARLEATAERLEAGAGRGADAGGPGPR